MALVLGLDSMSTRLLSLRRYFSLFEGINIAFVFSGHFPCKAVVTYASISKILRSSRFFHPNLLKISSERMSSLSPVITRTPCFAVYGLRSSVFVCNLPTPKSHNPNTARLGSSTLVLGNRY